MKSSPFKFSPLIITQFLIFLLPLFFLPITRDFIEFNKHMLLIAVSLASLILYAFKSIKNKSLTINFDRTHAAVLALAGAYIISTVFITPNKIEALLQPGGVGTIIALVILLFTVPQLTPFKSARDVITPLLLSGVVLSIFTLLNMFGILQNAPIVEALKNPNITPIGTLLTATVFLGIVAAVSGKEIVMAKKQSAKALILYGVAFLIVLSGTVVNAFRLTQDDTRPALLPTSASWTIAAENIKVPRQAFLGVGPGNYINAFTIGRTADMNALDTWNTRFIKGSNFILHTFTETGLLGLLSLLALIYFVIKHKHKSLGAIVSLIVLALIPHNVVFLTVLFLFLMVMSSASAKHFSLSQLSRIANSDTLSHAFGESAPNQSLAFIPAAVSVVLIVAAGAGLYIQSIGYQAETLMTKGIISATTPNNQLTYDLQLKAIQLNPYHSEYRIIFSRTNLALANLISQKPEPTEQDVQTVTQLVIQSVNNGKLAVQLKPTAASWLNLATIYRNLINSAQGAADWTVQSYNQAILFDRTNPLVRLSLGQVYYSLGLYQPAAQQFELAIQLKQDEPNFWYNAANAHRELGNYQVSRLAYNQVLSLLEPGSPDYETARAELEALPDTIAQEQRNLEQLQNPDETPEDAVATEVQLEEELASPELTFPEDVAGEATQSAETSEDFDLTEPSVSPKTSPTNEPTPTPAP